MHLVGAGKSPVCKEGQAAALPASLLRQQAITEGKQHWISAGSSSEHV